MEDVVEVRYAGRYMVWLRFEDGTTGEIDLSSELHGPVFEPLQNREYFAQVCVNRDTGAIEWPNGADLSPEFLYAQVQATESSRNKLEHSLAEHQSVRDSGGSRDEVRDDPPRK